MGGDYLVAEAWGPNAVAEVTLSIDGKVFRRAQRRDRVVFPFPHGIRPGRHVLEVAARDDCGFTNQRSVQIRVLPDDAPALSFEAEKAPKVKPKKNKRRRFAPARTVKASGPGGEVYCSLHNGAQQITRTVDVPRDGAWQIRVRARGVPYLDYPLVGVFVGEDDLRPVRYGPVATRARRSCAFAS